VSWLPGLSLFVFIHSLIAIANSIETGGQTEDDTNSHKENAPKKDRINLNIWGFFSSLFFILGFFFGGAKNLVNFLFLKKVKLVV
jgi:hypothetical protein